jgi:hypothetical protein
VIVDLYEAVDRMLWAIAAWIAAGAAVVTLLGYGLAALVWCAWTTVRRGVSGAMAARGARKPLSARLAASQAFGVPHEPDAPERASAPPCRHSHDQTGRKAA